VGDTACVQHTLMAAQGGDDVLSVHNSET
jgi:hypothetical protein